MEHPVAAGHINLSFAVKAINDSAGFGWVSTEHLAIWNIIEADRKAGTSQDLE